MGLVGVIQVRELEGVLSEGRVRSERRRVNLLLVSGHGDTGI